MSKIINISSNSNPEMTQSVEDFIELGQCDDMTYANFSIMGKIIGESAPIIYPLSNVIYDYLEDIKSKCITLKLSDTDMINYRYNPKKLSHFLYGSTELYFIILALNNMCSFKDFNKRYIKIINKTDLFDLLNKISTAEADYISKNRANLS